MMWLISYVTNRAIFHIPTSVYIKGKETVPIEPWREKTGLLGFRPGPTQTGVYRLRKWLEA